MIRKICEYTKSHKNSMEVLRIVFVCLLVCTTVCYASFFDYFWRDTSRSSRALSLNVDTYCANVFGQGSYLCRENYQTGYDYICDSLYCYNRQVRKCAFSIAPQDTTLCGNGKWCSANNCKRDPGALQTSDECPLGDSSNPAVALGKSCREIVSDRPSLCNDPKIGKIWCCDSCANITGMQADNFTGPALSANDDCQKVYGADSYFCMNDVHYNGVYGDNMCVNMYCFNSLSGQCEAVPADDGVPCGDGQWCVSGKCTNSSNAPVDPMAECYYGSSYQTVCTIRIQYPNIASYCSQPVYETGCCSFCLPHKNSSWAGCEYGDMKPDVCEAQVKAGTIKSYCLIYEHDCCKTCTEQKNGTDPNCPYGDTDSHKCATMIEDSIGIGNCYNQGKRQECCETCAEYYNATVTGCEYGDHWETYCAQNIKPPNVASNCARYEHQCCASCGKYRENGFPGCTYGDRDPAKCDHLIGNTTRGTANCYDFSTQSLCCATCHKLKDESTPNCLYGDTNPSLCKSFMNDTKGLGNCYDLQGQINCCRTCTKHRNDTRKGCEYGDHLQDYCSKNIFSNETAFLCFHDEGICCETCEEYKLSDIPDCKYGDKTPYQCKFMIPDEPTAKARCPTLSDRCCATCSRFGHPGIGGGISIADIVG